MNKYLLIGGGALAFVATIFLLVMFSVSMSFGLGNSTGTVSYDAGEEISKEEWLDIFKLAGGSLKVPWEVLAAIMWQESGLGHNFGNCSYFDPAPSEGHVLVDGNGLRQANDKTTFEEIIEKLIVYPKNKEVSCNPAGSNGGAMGYMQVMPPEWNGNATTIFNHKLTTTYPDPWKALDSIMVGGLVLKGKIGLGINEAFPEDADTIKQAAGKYYGDSSASYKDEVYTRYREIKELGGLP